MRVVTVIRRPVVEENVASNCVEHGTGGLNIDPCRIGTSDFLGGGRLKGPTDMTRTCGGGEWDRPWMHDESQKEEYAQRMAAKVAKAEFLGRWPANLILQHQPGCIQTGTTTAPGYQINRWTDGAKPFGGGAGHEYESEKQPDEQVAVWDCAEGCAVGALDGLEGVSRFFKQVETDMDDKIPEDLWAYLTTLISPPEKYEPNIIAAEDLSEVDFDKYEDLSVHGVITVGDPTAYLTKINRVLKPGGHFLVISERDNPNFQAICDIEDIGYEVRDSICYLDSADDKFHYVAKAAPKERNAGLKDKSSHPTVKPVAIMKALLADVPIESRVCDPFMGSGTTGIACLQTGHDFVGIEREGEYMAIADTRVRYWEAQQASKLGATPTTIESDFEPEEEEDSLSEELGGLFS